MAPDGAPSRSAQSRSHCPNSGSRSCSSFFGVASFLRESGSHFSARCSMAAFVERVLERPHRLAGSEVEGILHAGRFGMDGYRLVTRRASFQADPLVGVPALLAVHVGDMHLDMGEPLLEPLQL